MIKKFCDVCEIEVEEFHAFGGNIAAFGVTEVCSPCWQFLNNVATSALEQFNAAQDLALEAKIAELIVTARDLTLKASGG